MNSFLTIKFELVEKSRDNLLAVCFSKSQAQNYPIVTSLAKTVNGYKEIILDGKLFHFVVFEKSRTDAAKAISIINTAHEWKSFQIFTGGKLVQNYYSTIDILNCYLSALACSDWSAHCCDVIDDPFLPKKRAFSGKLSICFTTEPQKPKFKQRVTIRRFLFPCRKIQCFFDLIVDHPASPVNQIQALAISRSADWCPLFSPGNFRFIGEREEFQDVFD